MKISRKKKHAQSKNKNNEELARNSTIGEELVFFCAHCTEYLSMHTASPLLNN
jgi:hypothetical protein